MREPSRTAGTTPPNGSPQRCAPAENAPATVIIAADPSRLGHAEALARALTPTIEQMWLATGGGGPLGLRPVVACQSLHSITFDSRWPVVCLPALEQSPAELSALLARLAKAEACGLVLSELASGQHRPAPAVPEGLAVLHPLTPAPLIAGIVIGQILRQPTLMRLSQEVRVLATCSEGARSEIERVHDELQLAGEIQRDMLPRAMPSVPGLSIASLFRPVGYVSGDVYDMRMLDERRLAFFLADATGHGVPAALLTVQICRAMADASAQGPAARLAKLNASLCEFGQHRHRFATALAGEYDCRTGRMCLACAGHPAPVMAEGGQLFAVDTKGPMLGVFDRAEFADVCFELRPGQSLVLFSDGFECAFPDERSAGSRSRKGTREYLRRFAQLPWPAEYSGSAQDVVAGMSAALDSHAGSLHQADDVTALVLSRVGCAMDSLDAGILGRVAA